MFLDRKNQYCENDYTTKHNLQIQCNPYQITNGIFHIPKNLYGHKRPQITKTIFGKKNSLGGTSLVVQWFRLHSLKERGPRFDP